MNPNEKEMYKITSYASGRIANLMKGLGDIDSLLQDLDDNYNKKMQNLVKNFDDGFIPPIDNRSSSSDSEEASVPNDTTKKQKPYFTKKKSVYRKIPELIENSESDPEYIDDASKSCELKAIACSNKCAFDQTTQELQPYKRDFFDNLSRIEVQVIFLEKLINNAAQCYFKSAEK